MHSDVLGLDKNKRPKIFLSISAPIIMRNFLVLPGSVLECLKNAGFEIVILVPQEAYIKMKEDFAENGVIVEPIVVDWRRRTFLQALYKFVSYYLNFTEQARLFALHGIRLDKPVAGGRRFMYIIKVFIANTLGKSMWIRNNLMPKIDSLVYSDKPYEELFNKHKPALVFLPDVMSLQDVTVLREAKRQNIKTIGVPGSWDHLPKRFEPLHVDRLLVWSELFKKEALELQDYEEKNISVVGVPQYDLYAKKDYILSREEFLSQFNLDSNQKVIVLFSSGAYMPDDGDVADVLVQWIRNSKFSKSAQLFIRPYPAVPEEHKKFDKFQDEEGVYIDWIEPKRIFPHKGNRWYPTLDAIIHHMNLLFHADVIINTYSSVSVEASVFLKPIININFDGYKKRSPHKSIKRFERLSHYINVINTKGVRMVENEDELLSAVNEFLVNPDINKGNVMSLRNSMCWKVDGRAGERIVEKVLEYCD